MNKNELIVSAEVVYEASQVLLACLQECGGTSNWRAHLIDELIGISLGLNEMAEGAKDITK